MVESSKSKGVTPLGLEQKLFVYTAAFTTVDSQFVGLSPLSFAGQDDGGGIGAGGTPECPSCAAIRTRESKLRRYRHRFACTEWTESRPACRRALENGGPVVMSA